MPWEDMHQQEESLLMEEKNNVFSHFLPMTSEGFPVEILRELYHAQKQGLLSFHGECFSYFSKKVVKIYLRIDLPTRYNASFGIVKSEEPVFIVFSEDFQNVAPTAIIGREDFKFNETPHIYCEKNGVRSICLFRGNKDEWFAGATLEDYIKHVRAWYMKLASGELSVDGGFFEPLRLEGYSETLYYDYEKLCGYICESQNMKVIDFWRFTPNTYVCISDFAKTIIEDVKKRNQHCHAILLWDNYFRTNDSFDNRTPHSLSELSDFVKEQGFPDGQFDALYNALDSCDIECFIVIIALCRSKNLIGVNSPYQLINYVVHRRKTESGEMHFDQYSQVTLCRQMNLFTLEKAKSISGSHAFPDYHITIAGCGALGSKVAMHLVRAGIDNIQFVDTDYVSRHNLARHVLFGDSSGNKARELKDKAASIFPTGRYTYNVEDIINLIKTGDNESLDSSVILDFTASRKTANQLVSFIKRPRVISGAIYDSGRFALLLAESSYGNVRIDDLLLYLWSKYKTIKEVSDYLIRDKELAGESGNIVNVGLGCNSETFVLADDVISLYGASMSLIVKNELEHNSSMDTGAIYYMAAKDGNLSVERIDGPVVYSKSCSKENWDIRIFKEVIETLESETDKKAPKETGGYLLGRVNTKTHTIHVVDTIAAPKDSIHSETHFILGKEGIQNKLSSIDYESGSTFGYIGEWHSHPLGPTMFSEKDIEDFYEKAEKLRRHNDSRPLLAMLYVPDTPILCSIISSSDEDKSSEPL